MVRMRRWRRLLEELPLLCGVFGVVCAIRLGLWVLPFRTMRNILAGIAPRTIRRARRLTPEHLAWAVAVTSRFIPAASCLTQALATDLLLKRHGYLGVLHIGVAKKGKGRLAAHAWLEYAGTIIIGGRGHMDYTPLPPASL